MKTLLNIPTVNKSEVARAKLVPPVQRIPGQEDRIHDSHTFSATKGKREREREEGGGGGGGKEGWTRKKNKRREMKGIKTEHEERKNNKQERESKWVAGDQQMSC
jgi:hypothetical protein